MFTSGRTSTATANSSGSSTCTPHNARTPSTTFHRTSTATSSDPSPRDIDVSCNKAPFASVTNHYSLYVNSELLKPFKWRLNAPMRRMCCTLLAIAVTQRRRHESRRRAFSQLAAEQAAFARAIGSASDERSLRFCTAFVLRVKWQRGVIWVLGGDFAALGCASGRRPVAPLCMCARSPVQRWGA